LLSYLPKNNIVQNENFQLVSQIPDQMNLQK